MRRFWTDNEIEKIKRLYPENRCESVCVLLNRSLRSIYSQAAILNLHKSEAFKAKEISGRITATRLKGTEFQFKKGHVPRNKGMKWSEFMTLEGQQNSYKTTFKKGNLPHNTKYDGEISIREDKRRAYKFIRTSKGHWLALHVYNWITANGPVPDGMIVVFRSSDKMNCDLSNLEIITRGENMSRNTIQRYPAELKSTMKVLKKLTREINGKE